MRFSSLLSSEAPTEMESFGWDIAAPAATTSELNFPPCFWSGRQKEAGERSCRQPVVVDYGGGIAGGDVDLAEALLISSTGLRYGVKTGVPTKLGGVSGMEMGVRLPPLQPESMSSVSAAEVRQPLQEPAPWPAAAAAAAAELSTTGTAVTPWRDALTAFDHIGGHFGLAVDEDDDDDGEVSAILSNCDTIPNRRSCSENVSSGESENRGTHGGDKRPLHRRRSNAVGEVVSRASSNPDAIRPVMSQLSRKRKEAERGESAAEGAGSLCRNVDLQSAGSSATGGGFRIFFESSQLSRSKKPAGCQPRSSSIDFRSADDNGYEPDAEAIAQVKEMIYRAAAMRPVTLGAVEAAAVEKPKRKNVKISSDPQTVAARHRRERISDRLRVLQRLVPGGSKMDTASMLDEAANYLKFLKSQVSALGGAQGIAGSTAFAAASYLPPPSTSPFNPTPFPLQNLHTQIQTLVQKRVLDRPPNHLHI